MSLDTHEPSPERLIEMGFTETRLPPGTHICQIYSDDEERGDSLRRFLLSGLQSDECTSCFSDKVDPAALERFFSEHQVSLAEAQESGAFSLSRTSEVYFEGGRFDPDRMLDLLASFYDEANEGDFSGARVIGEMTSDISDIEGGSRLLEYESRVSILLRDHPITAVCQYDAHSFDGDVLMDVLSVHPMMVVRGSIVMNPLYVQPEEWLQQP